MTALPFDTGTTQCSTSGDWDHTGIISPRGFYTNDDGFYFAAECGLASNNHHYIVGVSAPTDANRAHSAKCATNVTTSASPVVVTISRDWTHTATASTIRSTLNSGSIGTPATSRPSVVSHEVATGVAQLESGEIDAISCNSAAVGTGTSQSTCNVLKFDHQNHCLQGCTGSSDWAVDYFKNACGSNQYVKGISKNGSATSDGEISAVLCCNWN